MQGCLSDLIYMFLLLATNVSVRSEIGGVKKWQQRYFHHHFAAIVGKSWTFVRVQSRK